MPNSFVKLLRASMTDAEARLWFLLRDRRLQGFKFRRQMPIGPYVADFVCLQTRLIVELDGGQHADQAEKDRRRDEWLRKHGFRVLRFWNNDVLANAEGVLQAIMEQCEKPTPHPYPSPARGEWFLGSTPTAGEGNSWSAPASVEEMGASREDRLRRLRWRCRRGLLELDLWLARFAERELNRLSAEECDAVEALLEEADADILAWLEGRQMAPPAHERIVRRIRAAG
jgi:very-short-patch-repair endonuclease/succinate dehydrogenase flavin-adding protein (antitoxin of CptAB toxin-antitoxin module)